MHTERLARQEKETVDMRNILCVLAACFLPLMTGAQTVGKEHVAAYKSFIQGFDSEDARNENAECFVEQVTLIQPATWGQADTLLYCLNTLLNPTVPASELDRLNFSVGCEMGVFEDLDAQQKAMLLSPRACASPARHMVEPIISQAEMSCALEQHCDWVSKNYPESRASCLRQYGRCSNPPQEMLLRHRDQCWRWRADLMFYSDPALGINAGGECLQPKSVLVDNSESSAPRTWQEQVDQRAAAESVDEFNMGGLDF